MSTVFPLDLVIPEHVIKKCQEVLEDIIQPSDSDAALKRLFPFIWLAVSVALYQDPHLGGIAASMMECEENIQHFGEGKFFELLRDTATCKDWCSLLKNGRFLIFHHCDKGIYHFLPPDVFFHHPPPIPATAMLPNTVHSDSITVNNRKVFS